MILIRVSFLWVSGLAFYPFVFVRAAKPSKILLNHERIHLRQQVEMGVLFFYIWYLVAYFWHFFRLQSHRKAYLAIGFEKEAYRHEHDLDYLQNRAFWQFLKHH